MSQKSIRLTFLITLNPVLMLIILKSSTNRYIHADPSLKKSEKQPPKEHKRYNLKKLTYEERKQKLIESLNALNAAAGGTMRRMTSECDSEEMFDVGIVFLSSRC